MLQTAMRYSHTLLQEVVKPGQTVVDATMGNGHDYVPDAVHAAIFNLGYLPKSDKKIITLPETTEQALQALIQRIVPCGRIILVCYYGHEGGPEELEAVHRFCRQLPQAQFNVLSYQFINQRNQPPVLFCIERKKTSENR